MELVKLSHSQSLLKVLQRAFGLRVLLVKQIVENVFVSLNQALRILLPVLQLFISITLNTLEKGSECQLLLVSQLGFLLLHHCVHLQSKQ